MDLQLIKGIVVADACLFLYRAKQMLPNISIQNGMPAWDGNILNACKGVYTREELS